MHLQKIFLLTITFVFAMIAHASDSRQDFPSQWWVEIPRDQAKSWETLPQDVGLNEVVLSKRTELGILSNFTEAPFVFHGICYPTIEGFWQMMKFPEGKDDARWAWAEAWKHTREQVSQMDGFAAKSAGGFANNLMKKNDVNWVTFEGNQIPFYKKIPGEHHDLILQAFIEKIRQNPEVLKLLMETKNLKLISDHKIDPEAPKEWHYNLIWTEIRELIKEKKLSLETSEDLSLRTCKAQ